MAVIRPFQGLRYSAQAGPIDSLTAPPYDVLTPAQRDEYAVRNPHNVVRLTLPEQQAEDRSKFVKYARSAALLSEWRRDGSLLAEGEPAIYRYTQSFSLAHSSDVLERTSFIALLKTEPYENGVVLPHEQTFPKHKEDRLRILEATRAHLECIFGLYEDPNGELLDVVRKAPAQGSLKTQSDDGVTQVLEPITDADANDRLVGLMADKKVWIADGHHRYETARTFRESLGDSKGPIAEDFLMMAFSSMSDPGLVLLPTHRIIGKLSYGDEEVLRRLGQYFDLRETHVTRLPEQLANTPSPVFGLALQGGRGFLMTPKDANGIRAMVGGGGSDELRSLDVTILHSVILDQILGSECQEALSYSRDAQDAWRTVNEGAAAAFLMEPPTVDDMKRIALGGEVMPQKSTYYFPKILSGLVLWSLNDFKP